MAISSEKSSGQRKKNALIKYDSNAREAVEDPLWANIISCDHLTIKKFILFWIDVYCFFPGINKL